MDDLFAEEIEAYPPSFFGSVSAEGAFSLVHALSIFDMAQPILISIFVFIYVVKISG